VGFERQSPPYSISQHLQVLAVSMSFPTAFVNEGQSSRTASHTILYQSQQTFVFIIFNLGPEAGFCEHGNEPSGSTKKAGCCLTR
jgi:hypothetical protein